MASLRSTPNVEALLNAIGPAPGEDQQPLSRNQPLSNVDRLLGKYGPAPEEPKPLSIFGEFTTGVKSGTQMMAPVAAGVGAAVTKLFGADDISQELGDFAQSTEEDIQRRFPHTVNFDEAFDSPGNAIRYTARLLGEQVPNLATVALGGGIGTIVGRLIGRGAMNAFEAQKLVRAFSTGGVIGATTGLEAGGVALEQLGSVGEISPGVVLITGLANGMLEGLVPLAIARRFGLAGGQANDLISKISNQIDAIASTPGRIGVGVLQTGGVEMATEILQEASAIAARAFVDENYQILSSQSLARLTEAGVGGAIVGGLLGGVGGAVRVNPTFTPLGDPEIRAGGAPPAVGEVVTPVVTPTSQVFVTSPETLGGDVSIQVGDTPARLFQQPERAQFEIADRGRRSVKILQVDAGVIESGQVDVTANLDSLPTTLDPARITGSEAAVKLMKSAIVARDGGLHDTAIKEFSEALELGFRYKPDLAVDDFLVIGDLPSTQEVQDLDVDPGSLTAGFFTTSDILSDEEGADTPLIPLFRGLDRVPSLIKGNKPQKIDFTRLDKDATTADIANILRFTVVGLKAKTATVSDLEQILLDKDLGYFIEGTTEQNKAKVLEIIKAATKKLAQPNQVFLPLEERIKILKKVSTLGLRATGSSPSALQYIVGTPSARALQEVPKAPRMKRTPRTTGTKESIVLSHITLNGNVKLDGTPYDIDKHELGTTVIVRRPGNPIDPKVIKEFQQIARFYDKMMKRFNVKRKMILTMDGLADPGSEFSIAGNRGWHLPVTDSELAVISLNTKDYGGLVDRITTATHEFGHFLGWTALLETDSGTLQMMLSAYNRFLIKSSHEKTNKRALVTLRSSPRDALGDILFSSNTSLDEFGLDQIPNPEYWFNFDEWFAEQTARWFSTRREPLGILERFFRGFARQLKQLFIKAHGEKGNRLKDFRAEPEIEAFLNHLSQHSKKITSTTEAAMTQVVGESLEESMTSQNQLPFSEQAMSVYGKRLFDKLKIPKSQRKGVTDTADKFGWTAKLGWTILQLAQLNPRFVGLQGYTETVDRWYNLKMKWVSRADQRVREWKALGRQQGDALAKMLFDLDSMNYLSKEEVEKGVTRQPTNDELIALARKHGLSAEAFEVYQRIREDFDDVLTAIQNAAERDLGQTLSPSSAEFMVEKARLEQEMNKLRQRPYFPHSRFGDFAMIIKDSKGKTVFMEQFTSQKEAETAGLAARKALATGQFSIRVDKIPESVQVFRGIPPALLNRMRASLKLSAEQGAWLDNLIIEFSPSKSFRKRLQRRKDVPGFSLDGMRSYASYFFHAAGHIAKVHYGGELQDIVNDAGSETSALGTQVGVESVASVVKRRKIIDFMQDHLNNIMDPKPDWAQIRSVAFQWWLGFVPSSAAMNLTQIPLVAWPYLSARYGDLTAANALRRATMGFQRRYLNKIDDVSSDYLWGMNLGMEQGFLDESMATELASTAEGANLQRLLPGSKAHRAVMMTAHWSAWLFQTSEKVNRSIVFRAAFELAIANPQAKYLQELQETQQIQFSELVAQGHAPAKVLAFLAGKDAIRRTQFEYASWARPRFMRGKKGVLFTFFMFMQNMVWFARFSPGRTRYLLMMFLAAGMMGMPGAEDLEAVVKFTGRRLFGKEWDAEKELRTFVIDNFGDSISPDLILHGVSRVGFGIPAAFDAVGIPFPKFDMSANIGMGQIIPGVAALGPAGDFETKFSRATTDIAGASFGIGINLIRAMSDTELPIDDFKRWERAMPRAIRNVMRGSRFALEGRERTRSGATVLDFDASDPDQLAEIVGQALGFNPTRLSRKWDRQRLQMESIAFWNIRRGMLLKQFDHAVAARDKEARADVLAAVRRFNRELPFRGKAISSSDLRTSVKGRIRRRRLFEAGLPASRRDIGITREIDRITPEVDLDVEDVSRLR